MRSVCFVVLACVCACGGEVGGADSGVNSGDSATQNETSNGGDSASASPLDGNWTGYFESYTFPTSQSDAVAFTLTSANGVVSGTVTYGNEPAPPAPTDPNGAYPPGTMSENLQGPAAASYIEGFVFTLRNGTFDGSRVKFGTSSNDVFAAWCAIQTQTWALQQSGYSCLPNWGFASNGSQCSSTNPDDSSQTISYACEKLFLCQMACTCNATSCTENIQQPDITFDMVFTTGALDGSTAGALGDHNVHLKKQ